MAYEDETFDEIEVAVAEATYKRDMKTLAGSQEALDYLKSDEAKAFVDKMLSFQPKVGPSSTSSLAVNNILSVISNGQNMLANEVMRIQTLPIPPSLQGTPTPTP